MGEQHIWATEPLPYDPKYVPSITHIAPFDTFQLGYDVSQGMTCWRAAFMNRPLDPRIVSSMGQRVLDTTMSNCRAPSLRTLQHFALHGKDGPQGHACAHRRARRAPIGIQLPRGDVLRSGRRAVELRGRHSQLLPHLCHKSLTE